MIFKNEWEIVFFYYTLVKANHNPETKHSFLAYYKKEFFNYNLIIRTIEMTTIEFSNRFEKLLSCVFYSNNVLR